jgi:hypothetical protein
MKRRRRLRRNPAAQMDPDVLLSALTGEMPPEMHLLLGIAHLASLRKSKQTDCACKGECLCHTGMQILGVPCPPDCKNFGNHFDGCHRCDAACQPPEKVQ